jgi:glutamyl-tRNA reductase
MRGADIVISSTSATHFVITKEQVASAMRGRGGRPLFLIDIAVPRDIEPRVNELSNVFLYDIDDLSGVVESNLEERMREAGRAEHIITEEIASFVRWRESLEVVPTVAAIRAKANVIRCSELEKARKRLGNLSEKDLETVEALTCAIVNKMLHGPTERLKQAANAKDGYEYVETVRHLYGLAEGETRGHGKLRNLLNRRARDVADAPSTHEMGDTLGC